MERLTETIYKKGYCNGKSACEDNCEECNHFETMVDRLAYYEDLEEQGLLLRLPVPIGGTVWGWEYPTRIDEEDGSTWTVCDIRRAEVVPKKFHLMMLDRMGDSYFLTKEEAEQKLASMQKGE